jgi:hypothetical protein
LQIPKDESSKHRENWTVSIQNQTACVLANWIEERENYAKCGDIDNLWLTRRENP